MFKSVKKYILLTIMGCIFSLYKKEDNTLLIENKYCFHCNGVIPYHDFNKHIKKCKKKKEIHIF